MYYFSLRIFLKSIPNVDENEDKIVGGDIVNDISERPFQVALETDYGFQFCGRYITYMMYNFF